MTTRTPTLRPTSRLRLAPVLAVLLALIAAVSVAQQQAVFAGKVLGPNGKGIANAEIKLSHQEDPSIVVTGTSDKKGKFEIAVLMPGPYEILVERKGFGPYVNRVDVETGMEYEAELNLQDEATYRQNRSAAAFNEGVQALQGGDEAAAEQLFKESAELNPNLPNPHVGLASLYHGQQRWEEAAASLDKFLAVMPLDAQLAPLAFEVYFETGNDQKAESALALVTSPAERAKLAPRIYNAGVRASQEEDLDLAMERFGQAADLDPQMVDAVQNMGAIEFNRKEYAAAVPYIERLLELDPVNTEGRRLLYYSYRELDDERVNDALASFLERANTEAVGIVADNAAADFE
ncbi:MAG: carboxypeptidase regulatory-like domain-containing protein, partial [Thermoanaerobaculia bacterium]|nr:carboxypeptidase regulatory-like domain-containing protein [Thermoanaerobaculia bacterium]